MEYIKKQELFEEFLAIWGEKFAEVPSIVKKLTDINNFLTHLTRLGEGYHINGRTYHVNDTTELVNLNMSDYSETQIEWVSLVAQFDNIIETSFFKMHLVPIELDGFTYFIDLSADGLSLITVDYYCSEPYQWFGVNVMADLMNFNNCFNDEYWDNYFVKIEILCADKNDELGAEVYNRGVAGLLPDIELTRERVTKTVKSFDYRILPDKIILIQVGAHSIGLLPHNCKIILNSRENIFDRNIFPLDVEFTIKGIVYAFDHKGYEESNPINIQFPDYPKMRAQFLKNMLFIYNPNKAIKNHIKRELDRLFIEKASTLKKFLVKIGLNNFLSKF